MRIFSTECGWVTEDQQFVEVYFIDGHEVSFEEYCNEMEIERKMINEANSEVEETEQHYEDCECPDCQEKNKMIYLAEAVKFMFENELCPQCVFEMLQDIYDKAYADGFDDGYAEMKEEMQDFLED